MASKSSTVILGFVEEQVSSRNQHTIDYTTNKIGGVPDWSSKATVPICKKCGRKLSLVFQIYAPLEGSMYHRTLYLFGCVTQDCWNRPHSWICLRGQVLDSSYRSQPTQQSSTSMKITEEKWFDDEDDWGGNDNDGNGNNDNFSFNPCLQMPYLDNVTKTVSENSGNINNLNVNSNSAPTIASVVRNMESKLNLNKEDTNANEAVCGAVGVVNAGDVAGSDEPSAEIEGSEEDMVAVDTPERPSTDIAALFKEAYHVDANVDAVFISYFVATGFEPMENTELTDHERELLLRYSHSTGYELSADTMCVDDGGGDKVYEKSSVIHGDTFIHKFKKRISREPTQVLRYCRDESCTPLWLYKPSPGDLAGKCSYCKGPMIFEAQVMPQLINFLRLSGVKEVPIEFGTVIVYTCLGSCWSEGETVRQEVVLVQCEVI